jgi:hypothetical protein
VSNPFLIINPKMRFSAKMSLEPKIIGVWVRSKFVNTGWIFLLAILACLPVYNIVHIIGTTGANNLSNDYALFLPLIDKIISGNYAWSSFFHDTFFVSHFQPLPILVYLANALITGWNVYAELFFIIALSIFRLILTFQVFTRLAPGKHRWLLMPILAALIFSNSQISAFEFGASAVPLGLTAFGFTLGIWALVKFKPGAAAMITMAVGGLVASWTAASGIIAWIIFLAGMIFLGYREKRYYLGWLISAILINSPYFYFLVLNRQPGTNMLFHSLLDIRLVVNLLGRPLANGISTTTGFLPLGEAAGWLGLVLGCLGLVLIIIHHRQLLRVATPALMFMAFGLLSAWQTSVYRVMIAPWYTSMVMPYWLGLAGLAILLFTGYLAPWSSSSAVQGSQEKNLSIYSALVLAILAGFYLATNLTYRDKSFYLISRSPVSASCLRNYEWAPTYCERAIFQWTVNRVYLADFAWPLQHNHLNVFSRSQEWTMQGDTILGNVYSPQAPNSLGVEWVDGLEGQPAAYSDYHHLALSVSAARSAVWEVNLPDNLTSATFKSAIAIGGSHATAAPVGFEVYIGVPGASEKMVFTRTLEGGRSGWHQFSLDLLSYQGQVINIRLAVHTVDRSALTLYQFPRIDLAEKSVPTLAERPPVLPVNTELSSVAPQFQPGDIIFDLQKSEQHGLLLLDETTHSWHVEQDPYFSIKFDTPIALAGYGWISFTESASADIAARAAEIYLYFDVLSQPIQLIIPLLADAGTHTYTHPLRMLGFSGQLTAVQFHPIILPSAKGENLVILADVRLIHLP